MLIRISKFMKYRPPSASEYRPLSGLDPTTHAGVCLRLLIWFDQINPFFNLITLAYIIEILFDYNISLH